jgi:hypothetical protein
MLMVQYNEASLCNLIELSFLAEVDLQHSSIWMAGVYLMLLIQFLENKVAIDLTRAEFVEAQEVVMFLLYMLSALRIRRHDSLHLIPWHFISQ